MAPVVDRGGDLDLSAIGNDSLLRLDSLTRSVSGSSTGSYIDVNDVVEHSVNVNSDIADKALSPALLQAFRETPLLMVCVFVASLNFICYGYDTGCIGQAQQMLGYKAAMGFTTATKEQIAAGNGWVTSVLNLAGGCICPFVGYLSEYAGRKKTMYVGCVINVIGSAIQAAAINLEMMIVGRVLTGFALGILISVAAPYMCELSQKSIRGFVGILCSLSITFGLLLSAIVAYCVVNSSKYDGTTWRWFVGVQAAIALATLLLVIPLPESPRWLVNQNRDVDARASLLKFRKDIVVGSRSRHITRSQSRNDHGLNELSVNSTAIYRGGQVDVEHEPVTAVDVELLSIIEDCKRWKESSSNVGMQTLFVRPEVRLRTWIAAMLPIAQAVSGQFLILWYGPQIYNSIGLNGQRAALVQNSVLFGSTILCLFLIDRIGRRALMLLGTIGCMSCMLGLSIIFFTTDNQPAQHGLANTIWALIIVYEFFYANSWAALPFMYPSEIFNTAIRGYGVAWASCIKYFGAFAVSKAAPLMLLTWGAEGGLNPSGTYLFFAAAGFLTLVYVFTNVPETKGVPLERMDTLFGVTSIKQYADFVWNNVRYNGQRYRQELTRLSVDTTELADVAVTGHVKHAETVTESAKPMLMHNDVAKEASLYAK